MSHFQYNLMEEDSLIFNMDFAKKNYLSRLNSNSGDYSIDFGDVEDDYEFQSVYPCPCCPEALDLMELCCHIDEEHPMEANSGVCPVCEVSIGMDMIEHITTHHRNIFKSQHRLKQRKLDYHSAFPSALKKLKDIKWESFRTGLPHAVSTSKVEHDPLMSFLLQAPAIRKNENSLPDSTNIKSEETGSIGTVVERNVRPSALSNGDQIEQTRRSGFVQGLLMSTILGDD